MIKSGENNKVNKNEIYVLTITDLDQDGNGIGHIQENGMAVFVKDTVPGDEAEVRIIKVKKNLAFGRLERIRKPSPDRVEPLCPKARACGGCMLQQMSYEAQLRFKEQKVRNCLTRIGGVTFGEDQGPVLEPVVGMESPWRFRNKMQFPVGKGKDGQPALGFYAGRTHALIPLEDCPIGHFFNRAVLDAVKEWIRRTGISLYDETTHKGVLRHVLTRVGFATGQAMVCLIINGTKVPRQDLLWDLLAARIEQEKAGCKLESLMININQDKTNRILGFCSEVLRGSAFIEDRISDLTFRISPQSFYQVNPVQTQKIYQKALDLADLSGNETVWDMYCGTGTISLFLARKARKVYGVEIVEDAIRDARNNARINNITNAEFFVGKAEEVVPRWFEKEGKETRIDVVVVDPPRKGCDEKLLETILQMDPKRLVYVSCDPATLSRDVRYLSEHGFSLISAQPFDAFCHSGHVETVALLKRKNG